MGVAVDLPLQTFISHDATPLNYARMPADENSDNRHPLVFVPGLGGSVRYAANFLQQLLPHHGPVFSLDARGFGINENVPPEPNPASYLKDFNAFIRHLQQNGSIRPDQHPVIIGISLGAVLSVLFTTQYPHPFKAMVLIAPAFYPHPKLFTWKFRLKSYAGVLRRGLKASVTLPYTIRELTRNEALFQEDPFKEPSVMPTFYLLLVDRLCGKAFKRSRKIVLPTAIIVPGNDFICDPEAMFKAFERIPHSEKRIFSYPELYHDVVMEPEPDTCRVCEDLSTWIRSL